jgi:hypothetical protein
VGALCHVQGVRAAYKAHHCERGSLSPDSATSHLNQSTRATCSVLPQAIVVDGCGYVAEIGAFQILATP